MAKGADRTKDCDAATRAGRLNKARQFLAAAGVVEALADEAADVAAADVVCCARLGRHAAGEDHQTAIELVAKADPDGRSHKHLASLLSMKTKAAYTSQPVTTDEYKRAGRAAQALVETAEQA